MSDDRRVTRRSNKQCRQIARDCRAFYQKAKLRPINILRHLKSGRILTVRGERKLIYQVVDDDELRGSDGKKKDAKTELLDGAVVITAVRSVDQLAEWGDGRSRMTLAHELGHGVMHSHEGSVDYRGVGATGTTELSEADASESAEHQAKVFASAFLIDDDAAKSLASPEDISTEFGVSLEAANICFERLQEEARRAESVDRVLKMNKDYQSSRAPRPAAPKFLDEICGSCKQRTLVPIGCKIYCMTCQDTQDRLQDGDH